MNKKPNFILVTGGAGFIGRNLCKKLLENADNKIICIDNLITGNLENIKEFVYAVDEFARLGTKKINIHVLENKHHRYSK